MKKTNVLFIALLGLLVTMTMCKKDEDNPPYVGSWETEEFSMLNANVKLDVDFTTTNLDGEIMLVAGPGLYIPVRARTAAHTWVS